MSDLTTPTTGRAARAVRLEATNHEGSLLGKTVSPAKFAAGKDCGFAFADILFAIDLNNEIVFGDAFPDWRGNLYDIAMIPDMSTLVEWKPGLDSVIGDYWLKNGRPVPICPRNLVKGLLERLAAHGYAATAAVEIEATLFEESVQEARKLGYRDLTPLGGSTGSTYHIARSSDWVRYMEAVVARLDELGIAWEAWTDEAAPGQTELNLAPMDALRLCDSWARTRQVMREVAHELGHTVSFMAKPTAGFGQGAHVNFSLASAEGVNLFYAEDGPSELMLHAVGGLMATMEGATSIVMPQITSYRRLVDLSGPPTTVSWGVNNKTAALRAITGHPKYSRLEYRVPGSDVNPYLALAVVLAGGLAGIERRIAPPPQVMDMAWCLPDDAVRRIPDTITKAGAALAADPLLREYLGDELVDFWVDSRRWEWMEFHTKGGDPYVELSAWESQRYFEFP